MNRTTSLPAAAAVVIGAAGAVLRLAHTRNCYEESGFLLRHHPLTGLLTAALVAIILFGIVTGAVLSIHWKKTLAVETPVSSNRPLPSVLGIVSAVLTTAAAVWQFLAASPRPALLTVCSVLGLAAALGTLALSQKPANRTFLLWSCTAVGVFFCLDLVRHFAANTLNPVTLSFGPECLALGATSLFAFCLGTSHGQARGFGSVCFGLCAVGLCLTSLSGPQITWPDRLVLLAGAMFALQSVLRLPLPKGADSSASDAG